MRELFRRAKEPVLGRFLSEPIGNGVFKVCMTKDPIELGYYERTGKILGDSFTHIRTTPKRAVLQRDPAQPSI